MKIDAELNWLSLVEGVPTEVTLLTDPYYAKIHPYIPSKGSHKNFGCRQTAPEGCYFCFYPNKPVGFAFAVVESAGELLLWQITRSVLKKVETLEAGTTVIITKLDRSPWVKINGLRYGDTDPLPDDLASVPEKVARSMSSIGYHLEHGPSEILDFLNARR